MLRRVWGCPGSGSHPLSLGAEAPRCFRVEPQVPLQVLRVLCTGEKTGVHQEKNEDKRGFWGSGQPKPPLTPAEVRVPSLQPCPQPLDAPQQILVLLPQLGGHRAPGAAERHHLGGKRGDKRGVRGVPGGSPGPPCSPKVPLTFRSRRSRSNSSRLRLGKVGADLGKGIGEVDVTKTGRRPPKNTERTSEEGNGGP